MWQYNYSNELYHFGVLGMKWGIRRNRMAALATQRDADNLKSHGYRKEAEAVQQVSDKHKQKASNYQKKLDATLLAKADKKWSKGFKKTAHKAMTEVYESEKVQKELRSAVEKLSRDGFAGQALADAYQVRASAILNKHLADSPTSKSPSGNSRVQTRTVTVNGRVFLTPYEERN